MARTANSWPARLATVLPESLSRIWTNPSSVPARILVPSVLKARLRIGQSKSFTSSWTRPDTVSQRRIDVHVDTASHLLFGLKATAVSGRFDVVAHFATSA